MYQLRKMPLCSPVHSIWYADSSEHHDEDYHVAPEPEANLVIKLHPDEHTVLLSGAVTRQKVYPYYADTHYFGIRFQPGYQLPDNSASLYELRDDSITLPKTVFNHLPEKLHQQATLTAQFTLLYQWASNITDNMPVPPAAIQEALYHVHQRKGVITIRALSQLTMLSERHLERLFKTYTGLSPKQFCNTVRIQALLNVLWDTPEKPALSDLALKFGYCDQSHLANHFRNTMQVSITEYLQR